MVIASAAFILAVAGTPLARRAALRLGTVDRPAERKLHSTPMPLLGGLAVYAAVIGSLLLFPERKEVVQLAGIVIGASWVSLLGLWDDQRGMHPALKLIAQLAAGAVLIAVGIQVAMQLPGWANVSLTLLWVVGITNAFKLLDNMDGLSSGVGAVAAACFLLMAAMNDQYLVSGLAAGVLGACLGFLVYNFNPATIFMGDSGSLFLGFVLAALGIKLRFPANTNWVTWMVPVLVLGVPVFDTTLVVISRLRRRTNPFTSPGKDHVSHRLVRLGWTEREVVLLLYLAGCALGAIATFVSLASPREAYTIMIAVILVAVAAISWLERRGLGDHSGTDAPSARGEP
jgi:UDP-GlcNAc:undecaprenyl-phosphate GlcNAc-1-phosphate transferase